MSLLIPRRIGESAVHGFGVFSVERRGVELPGRAPYDAHVIHCLDWVAAVAITGDGRFVLVRQHRHGIDAVTLEPAGGLVDPGEGAEEAAIRELREETGYVGARAEPLGVVHPNPALQDNRFSMFLVRGAERAFEIALDEHESTEVALMDRAELERALEDGGITHALAVLSLERALRRIDAR